MNENPEILKTLARFIENCDKGEAELLSRYVNYLKSFIPQGVYYRDFEHWARSVKDGQSAESVEGPSE